MAAYGAWGEKTMYGKKTVGVIRSTVWIGPDGTVRKQWQRVANAEKHPEQVLHALREKRRRYLVIRGYRLPVTGSRSPVTGRRGAR